MSETVRTTAWRAADLRGVDNVSAAAPVIRREQVVPIASGHDVWDLGPVRTPAGEVADVDGRELWIVISAPADGHPGGRHDRARLRLLTHRHGTWRDHGTLFPDGASRGSREWAASGVYDAGRLHVWYTAVGGPGRPPFDQRIAATSAEVRPDGDRVVVGPWASHRVVLQADGTLYMPADAPHGEPGFIKAFRDPFPVLDPADGREWLLFTGSLAGAASEFNGAVGIARRDNGRWVLCPPLITGDGVNNELERPHVVRRNGRCYLFFSTQRRTFAPGVTGPNGLYGFVADHLPGPYEPVNGTGLVLRNPDEEPFQAYSWLVLPDLRVVSFVDAHSLGGRSPADLDAEGAGVVRRHFGGTIAPILTLALDGASARLAG